MKGCIHLCSEVHLPDHAKLFGGPRARSFEEYYARRQDLSVDNKAMKPVYLSVTHKKKLVSTTVNHQTESSKL